MIFSSQVRHVYLSSTISSKSNYKVLIITFKEAKKKSKRQSSSGTESKPDSFHSELEMHFRVT